MEAGKNATDRERQFIAHINSDAPLEMIVRGHLWIEYSLIGLIEEVLPFPKALDLARFSFPQKIGLALGLGLVRSEDAPAYLKLNSLRNRAAHELNSAITEKEEAELIHALSPELRFASCVDNQEYEDEPFPEPLRAVMATLLIDLDRVRESVIRQREEVAALHKRVQELRAQSEGRHGQ